MTDEQTDIIEQLHRSLLKDSSFLERVRGLLGINPAKPSASSVAGEIQGFVQTNMAGVTEGSFKVETRSLKMSVAFEPKQEKTTT